jgi:hypothetical protein
VKTLTFSGADVTNMQDIDVLATVTLPVAGDYVLFAHFDAHNTGTTCAPATSASVSADMESGLSSGHGEEGGFWAALLVSALLAVGRGSGSTVWSV